MYSKNEQIAIHGQQDLVKDQQQEITLVSLLPAISKRLYDAGDVNTMHRLEIAIGERQPPSGQLLAEVPEQHTAGLFFLAMRKGGRRVGLSYNLVTNEELTLVCAQMIPAMCLFMGVPMDNAYMAMAFGIAQHIRRVYPTLTIEELELFSAKIYEVPVEHMPTSYKVFDMPKMATVLAVYVKHVVSKQMGKAGAWLKENCKTEYDLLFEARRTINSLPGGNSQQAALRSSSANYPENIKEHLLEACQIFNKSKPNKANFLHVARQSCGVNFILLAEYIEAELLTLGENEKKWCYSLAWSYMKAESIKHTQTSSYNSNGKKETGGREANRPRYERMLKEELNDGDTKHLLVIVRRYRAALQMFKWYQAGVDPY